MPKCGRKCEVYSRVVGYYRSINNWNLGKRSEFYDRLTFEMLGELKDVAEETKQNCSREEDKGSV